MISGGAMHELLAALGFPASPIRQNYRGADREEILKAGAKKEGKLVWYTSLTAHREKLKLPTAIASDQLPSLTAVFRPSASFTHSRCAC
jgi:hypothetical protein